MSAANYAQMAFGAMSTIAQSNQYNRQIELRREAEKEQLAEWERQREKAVEAEAARRSDITRQFQRAYETYVASAHDVGLTENALGKIAGAIGYTEGISKARSQAELRETEAALRAQQRAIRFETAEFARTASRNRSQTFLGFAGSTADAFFGSSLYKPTLKPDASLSLRRTV
jgi:hypothetical protein